MIQEIIYNVLNRHFVENENQKAKIFMKDVQLH